MTCLVPMQNPFVLPNRTNVSYSNECIMVSSSMVCHHTLATCPNIDRFPIERPHFTQKRNRLWYLFLESITWLDFSRGQHSDMHRMLIRIWFYLCLDLTARDTVSESNIEVLVILHQYFQDRHTHARTHVMRIESIQNGIRISNKLVSKIIFHLAFQA